MKKFKRIFYPIYILFALGFIYLSIDGLLNMDDTRSWFSEKFRADRQPFWIMFFFFLLTVLMLIEIIVENVHIRNIKSGVEDMEDEIVRLKAKLYDKLEDGGEDEDGEDEDDEEDDDEDDDKD